MFSEALPILHPTAARSLVFAAGVIHFCIVVANLFAPARLRYRQELAPVTPIIRQIFFVHSAYIVLVLVGFTLLCFIFPEELTGRTKLGHALCGFLAFFWMLRSFLQSFYYDPGIKRANRGFNVLFTTAFFSLGLIFTCLTIFRA